MLGSFPTIACDIDRHCGQTTYAKEGGLVKKPLNFLATRLFLIVVLPSVAVSQETVWRVGVLGRDTLSECILQALDDNLITFVSNGTVISLPIDSVDYVSRHKESHFWTGAGYGTLVGCTVGALAGYAAYHKPEPTPGEFTFDFGPGFSALAGGMLGSIGGFVIGGAIGASAGGDEMYKLSGKPHQMKVMMIRTVMLQGK